MEQILNALQPRASGNQYVTPAAMQTLINTFTFNTDYVADIAKDQGLPLSPFVCQFIPLFLQPALCQKNKGS